MCAVNRGKVFGYPVYIELYPSSQVESFHVRMKVERNKLELDLNINIALGLN